MRIVLGLVFLVGCAEATNAPGDAPDPGSGRREVGADASSPDTGMDTARACNDTIDTLSGRATYIAGSAAAVDPEASSGTPGVTCAGAVASIDWNTAAAPLDVSGGVALGKTGELVASAPAAAGCSYRIRFSFPVMGYPSCQTTRDYALAVP
jgi:hypothetical protein